MVKVCDIITKNKYIFAEELNMKKRLYKIENNKYKRVQTVSLWLYLLILIPVHIVDLCLCLWDGGLKEFQFQPRPTRFDIIHPDTKSWERANKIYMEKGGK